MQLQVEGKSQLLLYQPPILESYLHAQHVDGMEETPIIGGEGGDSSLAWSDE